MHLPPVSPRQRAIAPVAALLLLAFLPSAPRAAGVPVQRVAVRTAKARPAARAATPADWQARRGRWFQRNWGVDIVGVRRVASGYMLRFDYRVLDPVKAAVLGDHAARPYLIDESSRTALSVPAMENVGELRQTGAQQPDRTYYVLFGNPGRLVKHGSKVTLVVGSFRAEGLVVD